MMTSSPNYAAILVVDVVNLIENDEFNVLHEGSAPVKHRSQNFSCHDEAGGVRVQLDVAGEQADTLESFLEITKLLIWKCLYGASINGSIKKGKEESKKKSINKIYNICPSLTFLLGHVLLTKGNGVFSHDSFPGRSVRRHKHRFTLFQMINGLQLKRIQRKGKWCQLRDDLIEIFG